MGRPSISLYGLGTLQLLAAFGSCYRCNAQTENIIVGFLLISVTSEFTTEIVYSHEKAGVVIIRARLGSGATLSKEQVVI